MTLKSLLLGSAAAMIAASGAHAADAIIAPEPESVEYVRVCDAYGAGYFYIPGTETCLRISGYVRYDAVAGDDAYSGIELGGWYKSARFALRTHTASETELGTLKTFTETRFNYQTLASGYDGDYGGLINDPTELRMAYITLGGFKVGIDESTFHTFTGYLGDVINDDVVAAGSYRTSVISYTFKADNGFSAVLAVEDGGDEFGIDDYVPHVVGGLKFEQAWGKIAAVGAYDAVLEEWAAKVRGDVNITDRISVWLQGGYSSEESPYQNYGQWGGKWAVWGGAQFKATDKATFNLQGAYEDWGKLAVTANVAYELVPGFVITPEVSYTRFDKDHPWREFSGIKDAVQGMVRFQRSF